MKKNFQTVLLVITPLLAESDTAIRIRFGMSPVPVEVLGTSIIWRNQRLVSRSYRICGSLVVLVATVPPTGVATDEKKTSVSTLSTPSAAPVALVKDRSRPFTIMMNCDGPA